MSDKEDYFHLGVKALIHNCEGKLLLLKKVEKAFWDLPGGRIHKGESLEDALKREVYEETGLQNIVHMTPFATVLTSIRIPVQNGDVGLIFATYLCDIEEEAPIHLSDEHTHFDWFEPSTAAKLLSVNYPGELTEKLVLHQASKFLGKGERCDVAGKSY